MLHNSRDSVDLGSTVCNCFFITNPNTREHLEHVIINQTGDAQGKEGHKGEYQQGGA